MPELPEVEITRRAIAPYLEGKTISGVQIRSAKLRQPIPVELATELPGQSIHTVERRGKYLLLRCSSGSVILHLGMTGHLRIVPISLLPTRHDHLDILLTSGKCLRFHDPRRFGLALWTNKDPFNHPLIASLGPEPLSDNFDGSILMQASRNRRIAVKPFLMNSRVLAGIGNIYANEALFRAGILPSRQAGSLSTTECNQLGQAIKEVLLDAVELGNSTLQNFVNEANSPVYFTINLSVYGRKGEPCPLCGNLIQFESIGQRSSYFCLHCQR